MIVDPQTRAARLRVAEARARLERSVATAKARLRPSALASNAVDGLTSKAGEIASDGVDAVRTRPVLAGVAALAAGLLLVRKPLRRAMKPAGDDEHETSGA